MTITFRRALLVGASLLMPAAAFAQTGDGTAAHAHAQEVVRREPGFSVEGHLATLHYKRASDRAHQREGLLKLAEQLLAEETT